MLLVLVYNLAMLAIDAVALCWIARQKTLASLGRSVVLFFGCALAFAIAGMLTEGNDRYYGSYFTLMGLFAQALFWHGAPMLFTAAYLLRRELRGVAATCVGLALLLAGVAIDAFFIEPAALEVNYHRIVTAKLQEPVRLVVLADLQTQRIGDHERRAVRRAMELDPDLLLLPGDYGQVPDDRFADFMGELNALFREGGLAAPLGIYAVEGNVDRDGWTAAFDGLGVTTYVETATTPGSPISVTGLSFTDSFRTNLTVGGAPGFHIALGHAPDFSLGQIDADLLVAGHTHGGQIQLPGFGPLLTLSQVPRPWASGRTDLDGGRTLIVSRGVGMERGLAPPVRFFCRPELVVIELVPERVTPRGAAR